MKYLFLNIPNVQPAKRPDNGCWTTALNSKPDILSITVPPRPNSKSGLSKAAANRAAFFNASGLRYKALNLKEKLPGMSDAEQISLLASDGMLVKRPLLVGNGVVFSGFRPGIWQQLKD